MVIRTGDVGDERGKLGVANFATRLMRRGAAGKSAEVLSEEIEFLGATLSGYAEEERSIVSFNSATKHMPAVLELMAQTILQPEFSDHEVELSRRRSLAQLVNEFDDPDALVDRALDRVFWGSHPYGNEMNAGRADLEAITRADLVKFQSQRIGPRISHLYVVGDVELDETVALAEKLFGRWSGGPAENPVTPPFGGLTRAGEVVIVDKPDQTQVQLRIASLGAKRGHADLYPVTVMNSILGGGFTSRLVKEVRVKRGLSYGASSEFDNLGVTGIFTISSFTKNESITELIDVALGEVAKFRKKGATASEVDTVTRYIAGLFPSKLETNDSLASLISDIESYGLQADWAEQYRGNIASVTAAQVNAAAKKYLPDDQRVIVLVGNANQIEPRVKKYGRVSVVKQKDLE